MDIKGAIITIDAMGTQKAIAAQNIAPVTAFETGTNEWRRYSAWPPKEGDKTVKATPLYLRAGLKLSDEAPKPGDIAFGAPSFRYWARNGARIFWRK